MAQFTFKSKMVIFISDFTIFLHLKLITVAFIGQLIL